MRKCSQEWKSLKDKTFCSQHCVTVNKLFKLETASNHLQLLTNQSGNIHFPLATSGCQGTGCRPISRIVRLGPYMLLGKGLEDIQLRNKYNKLKMTSRTSFR